MKNIFYILMLCAFSTMSRAQTTDRNYIRTRTYTNESGTIYRDEIRYFDGFGRPDQVVQKGITPSGKDLITRQEYDHYGRESTSWLPVVSTADQGAWTDRATFTKLAQTTYNGESRPFTIPEYENSPLNRVVRTYGPGFEWVDHPVHTDYLTNTNAGVLKCSLYKLEGESLVCDGIYRAGELYVTRQTDEESNTTYTFTDKLERTVLIRQMLDGTPLDTYYVYDIYGNLRYVLPPLAADRLVSGQWNDSEPNLMLYAYIYRYDYRNRCIEKKLPGAEPVRYIYDRGDRLIFSQDGEQREKGEWLFTLPDVFSRTVLTGICKNVLDYLADPLKDYLVRANYGTGDLKGYGIEGITLTDPVPLAASYYDDYNFLSLDGFTGMNYIEPEQGYGVRHSSAKGQLTGTWVAAIGSDTPAISSAIYYDIKSRPVQVQTINHLGGTDSEYTVYDFIGQVLKTKRIHTVPGKPSQTEVYAYAYDHAGRLTETRHKLNDGAEILLAKNSYDELGRLQKTEKNGISALQTSYDYNIRSWTTGINGSLFKQNLSYTPSGNIAAMEWHTSGQTRKYNFSYDALSRLTVADYTGAGMYSSSYEYDKHGNITGLLREGRRGANTYGVIDHLTLGYTGNQLTHVRDAAKKVNYIPSDDFRQQSNAAVAYSYNKNGAMTKDLNKGITDISYNFLNLTQAVQIESPAGSGTNTYTYSADGRKLRTEHQHELDTLTTDYAGNVIYENEDLKRILVDGGYWQDGKYHFYLTDHLGNNRVVTDQDGKVIQTNHYYPFGMSFAESTEAEADAQPYQNNGKEIDRKLGLNLYDYSARYMDPAIGRFTTVDPMAEKYYPISPYAYVNNNPLKFVDPDGMAISPYYDANGNFLGIDEYGFNGEIYITTQKAFANNSQNGVANAETLQASFETTSLKKADLSNIAESNVYTHVLNQMDDISMDKLYNGKVSIREESVLVKNEMVGKGYNDPTPSRKQSRYNSENVDGQIKVTASKESYKSDLFTVESIQNHLGVHEYWGHGVMGYRNSKFNHSKAYEAQIKHPTFKKLTSKQQTEIRNLYIDYKNKGN